MSAIVNEHQAHFNVWLTPFSSAQSCPMVRRHYRSQPLRSSEVFMDPVLHPRKPQYTPVATERGGDGAGMAKRDKGTTPTNVRTTTADEMEQRVLAFAEQLGRIAGAFQAKAEGWMDREALNKQITSVRDGAADLLEQLAGGATKASKRNRPPRRRAEEPKGVAAAWSTHAARNIVSRCRRIRARTLRTVRRPRCGRQRRWSRRTGAAGAGS